MAATTTYFMHLKDLSELPNAGRPRFLSARAAAQFAAASPTERARLGEDPLLVEYDVTGLPPSEAIIDALWSHPSHSGTRWLVTLNDETLGTLLQSEVGVESPLALMARFRAACEELVRQTGMKISIENRIERGLCGLTASNSYAAMNELLRADSLADLTLCLDHLLLAKLESGTSVDSILPAALRSRVGRCLFESPMPNERDFASVGLTLNNYPREIWALFADFVKLSAETPDVVIRRLDGAADSDAQAVARWAGVFLAR